MKSLRSFDWRHFVVALLICVLTLDGVGRGIAAVSDIGQTGFAIPGVAVPICHAGRNGNGLPSDQTHHDCCEACALLAPVTLGEAPSLNGPASVLHYVAHAEAMAWVPAIARTRSPRQSQGPPSA